MSDWPRFDVDRDSPTIAFLHLASQMPGKLRVARAPWLNHGWHVALHPVGEGLVTMPTASADGRTFTITLDLCDGGFALRVSDGARDFLPFRDGMSIADLHALRLWFLRHTTLNFTLRLRVAQTIPRPRHSPAKP